MSVSARRIPQDVGVFKNIVKTAAPVDQAGEAEFGSAGAVFDGVLGSKRLIRHTAKPLNLILIAR